MADERVGSAHEDAGMLGRFGSIAVFLVAVAVVDPHADDLLGRRNGRQEDDVLQRVVGRTARRYLPGDRQRPAFEQLAQTGELGTELAAEIDDASTDHGAVPRRAAPCEREELHVFASATASRLWTCSWRLFFFQLISGSISWISRETPSGERSNTPSRNLQTAPKTSSPTRRRVARSRPCAIRRTTWTNPLSGCPSAMRKQDRSAARVRVPPMGKTPVRRAAWWTQSIKSCGPSRVRRLAEYSTTICGIASSSVRASQGALDFPGRDLGDADDRGQAPVREARREGRDAHRGCGLSLRVPDRDADARDLLHDVTLGKGVLPRPRLLDLPPDARGAHGLEPGEVLGVRPENLIDVGIRQGRQQGEAPRADA